MSARIAAFIAALIGVLGLPAAAAANPAVAVDVVSATNMATTPATVVHRLSLTAGAADEAVTIRAAGRGISPGGSAIVTAPPAATGGGASACQGRWSAVHDALAGNGTATVGITIPAGTSAWVDVPVELSGLPYLEEDLDALFEVTPAGGKPFEVISRAPRYTGPIAPEMSLVILPAQGKTAVIAGDAGGVGIGRVEIWGYPPGSRSKARRLKTVSVKSDGTYSWATWDTSKTGRWELYAKYRRTARAPVTGATECGVLINVAS